MRNLGKARPRASKRATLLAGITGGPTATGPDDACSASENDNAHNARPASHDPAHLMIVSQPKNSSTLADLSWDAASQVALHRLIPVPSAVYCQPMSQSG
jgi:hypothetical protein